MATLLCIASGGIVGVLLYLAGYTAKNWQFWFFIIANALIVATLAGVK